MAFNHIKHILGNNFINAMGWHTNRKIIVIESDDWGSIRMPSIETLEKLITKKVNFDLDLEYDKIDTIASQSDLENLFEVLNSVKDKKDNPAIMTANCVVANPNFEKIRASSFTEYHYELMTETMGRYYPQANPINMWKQGLDNSVFYPQFHGREHLNAQLWLNLLRNDIGGARAAFNETVFSQVMDIPNDNRVHVLSAYNYRDKSEQQFIKRSIIEGLNIFENLFGYRSVSAISPCCTWDDFIEKCYIEGGIKYIQGGHFQIYSTYQKKLSCKNGKYHFCGEKNKFGQYYLVRNCFFEPSQDPNINFVDDCLSRIKIAFRWKKPAIISAHRLNFIGALNVKNRDVNLKLLGILLKQIVRQWPEVEFMTSDSLGELIRS